jgi:hypothetical protein
VVKSVDTSDLKSDAERRAGSSPAPRIDRNKPFSGPFLVGGNQRVRCSLVSVRLRVDARPCCDQYHDPTCGVVSGSSGMADLLWTIRWYRFGTCAQNGSDSR